MITLPPTPVCDGLCVSAADLGVGRADQIAYPHPSCPLHAPGKVCECGQPDRCLSPTHDPGYVEQMAGSEPPNDIEATGGCRCAGCVGMGPCDRGDDL